MVDPRTAVIAKRLRGVKRIIAVSSGKGGVGKSLIASTLALTLTRRGFKVGLLDLDFTSPSTNLILGVKGLTPKEEKGIVPPPVDGLEYMSIVYYAGENAVVLRGEDTSNALIELLTVTRWGKLDFLILDMPPGIGDATLDLIRLIERLEFVVVTTPSQLALGTVRKLVGLLTTLKIPVLGVAENMVRSAETEVQKSVNEMGVNFLGRVCFDENVERVIGDREALMRTSFVTEVGRLAKKLYKISA